MRQIRKILRDKRGEGYIDVAVMVLCVMLVIALGVRLFPIFITKMQVQPSERNWTLCVRICAPAAMKQP